MCVTSDPSILIDVIDIDPIPLGVATASPDAPPTLCTKQGYLPIPLLDGSYHYQPFLYNPNATIPSSLQHMSCGRPQQFLHGDSRGARTHQLLTHFPFWTLTATTFLFYLSPPRMASNIAQMLQHPPLACDPRSHTRLLWSVLHQLLGVYWSRNCGPLVWVTAVNGNSQRSHYMLTAPHQNFFLTHCVSSIIRSWDS